MYEIAPSGFESLSYKSTTMKESQGSWTGRDVKGDTNEGLNVSLCLLGTQLGSLCKSSVPYKILVVFVTVQLSCVDLYVHWRREENQLKSWKIL